MNKTLNMVLFVAIAAALIVSSGAIYVVDETEQVVVTQFGEPIGDPITEAGLKFKLPFVQTINVFDKRILKWDGDPNQIPTRDKRYIWVDTTARWRIVDSLKFMRSVRTEVGAQARLDDIIDAATRDVISNNILVEAVRDSNRLIDDNIISDEQKIAIERAALESVAVGREEISRKILNISREEVPNYGIELVDVRIKRINYQQDVQRKAFERMISERKRAAEQFRSEGQGKRAEIEGQIIKELKQIQSEAYRKAQEIKGKADAKAIKIYADAYNRDPDFYAFVKTLETYKKTINDSTDLILSTDNELYRALNGVNFTDRP